MFSELKGVSGHDRSSRSYNSSNKSTTRCILLAQGLVLIKNKKQTNKKKNEHGISIHKSTMYQDKTNQFSSSIELIPTYTGVAHIRKAAPEYILIHKYNVINIRTHPFHE